MNVPSAEPNGNPPAPPFYKRFIPILVMVAVCWVVLAANALSHGRLNQYGIIPLHLSGLTGILWAPFLHGSFHHLAANTLPLLVLGGILCARSKTEFTLVTLGGIVLGGGLTWVVGRQACHIGASGLIFCYFGYLGSLAFFRRTFATLVLSVVCLIGYGGMLRGVLPTQPGVSWESHACGLAAGIALGWLGSKLKKTPAEAAAPTAGAS